MQNDPLSELTELSDPNVIRTLILASPGEAETIHSLLDGAAPGRYQVLAKYQDLADESVLEHITNSSATLVIVHQSVGGFTVGILHRLAHARGGSAKVVAAIVAPVGDVFDAVLHSGAAPYRMPTRPAIFRHLHETYLDLLSEANQRLAAAVESPPPPPEPPKAALQSYPGQVRQALQVITAWSSKGGDGKSLLAMELAYSLANLAGRKVLLVDADMNRGYIAPALGREMLRWAGERNITVLAALFHARSGFPKLAEFTVSYPPAFGKGESNLTVLLGITSPEQSGLPCYGEGNGLAGRRFIESLIEQARPDYEFIIFDIGTLIPVPIHAAAISSASTLLVASSPMIPAIQPTRLGLDQMHSYNMLGEKRPMLVLNKWTEDCGLSRDDFSRFLKVPTVATIPAVPLGEMQKIVNSGRFVMQAYLADPEKHSALLPLAVQMIALAEIFSPGARAQAERVLPRLGKTHSERRRGLFGRLAGSRAG
jgi:Mrp family chromosome partitioning ATPase